MSLAAALRLLAPTADRTRDFRIEDRSDGNGQQIVFWNEAKLGPAPTQAQIDAAIVLVDAEKDRVVAIRSDSGRADLLNRLKTATASEIKTYVANTVADLASARTLIAKILLLIALDARNGS